MKNIFYLPLLATIITACNQNNGDTEEATGESQITEFAVQDITGAWETQITADDGQPVRGVAIITEDYISNAFFNEEQQLFMGTFGGSWTLKDDSIFQKYEYHTMDNSKVGNAESYEFTLVGDTLKFTNGNSWIRVDDGTPGALAGAWLITGRMRNGEIRSKEPGPRKTMKILSGKRFQWIAYNSETAEFFGTGGGTYLTGDTTYTENIEFFSRDSSRIGATLDFTYKLDSGQWHHQGLSSKGDPIYEIWSLRRELNNEDQL